MPCGITLFITTTSFFLLTTSTLVTYLVTRCLLGVSCFGCLVIHSLIILIISMLLRNQFFLKKARRIVGYLSFGGPSLGFIGSIRSISQCDYYNQEGQIFYRNSVQVSEQSPPFPNHDYFHDKHGMFQGYTCAKEKHPIGLARINVTKQFHRDDNSNGEGDDGGIKDDMNDGNVRNEPHNVQCGETREKAPLHELSSNDSFVETSNIPSILHINERTFEPGYPLGYSIDAIHLKSCLESFIIIANARSEETGIPIRFCLEEDLPKEKIFIRNICNLKIQQILLVLLIDLTLDCGSKFGNGTSLIRLNVKAVSNTLHFHMSKYAHTIHANSSQTLCERRITEFAQNYVKQKLESVPGSNFTVLSRKSMCHLKFPYFEHGQE